MATLEELKKRAKQEYEEEQNRKKEQTTSQPANSGTSSLDALKKRAKQEYDAERAKVVDSSYITSFLDSTNKFFSSVEEETGKVGWGNASTAYQSRANTWNDLDQRRGIIRSWLDLNKDKYAPEDYEEFASYLDALGTDATSVLDWFKSTRDHYSQWKTEDAYNLAMEKAKADADRWEEITGGYDPSKHLEKGKAGWADYVATQDRWRTQAEAGQDAQQEKSGWEKFLGYIGDIGRDTTLPFSVDTNEIAKGYQAQETEMKYPTDEWTEEQKNTFGYLWGTQRQKAHEYAYAINNALNVQAENAQAKKVQDSATDNVFAGAGHTLGAIATAPLGLADYLGNLIAYGSVDHFPQADGELTPFEYSQAVTSGVAQHLNEAGGTINENIPILGGKGWGDVYGLGTSIAQSSLAAYTGGSAQALITFFGSAAASGVKDATSRGATGDQAMLYGTAVGAAEALSEMIGIDNLMKIGSSNTVRQLMVNLLKQSGAEGLEEGVTAFLSNVADNLVMGNKSNFALRTEAYIMAGLSMDEAKKKAWTEMAGDIVFDMLGGFASGGIHAGPQTAYHTFMQNSTAKATYGASEQDLVAEGLESAEGSMSHKLATKYKAKLDAGKHLSGGQLSQLVEANERQFRSEDMASIRSAAESRLTELGETGDVSAVANALAKQVAGEKLSRAEQRLIATSKYGQRVSNELNPENIRSGDYSSAWAESIGTSRINAAEYNADLMALAEEKVASPKATTASPVAPGAKIAPTDGTSTSGKGVVTETSYEVSKGGKTMLDGTEVKLSGLRKLDDGSIVVATADNQTADPSEIEYAHKGQALVFESYSNLESYTGNPIIAKMPVADRSALAMGYDPASGIDGRLWVVGSNEAYWYGFEGISLSTLPTSSFAKHLPQEQITKAYALGRAAAEASAKAQSESVQAAYDQAVEKLGGKEKAKAAVKKAGKVILEHSLSEAYMTSQQKASYKLTQAVASTSGTTVHVYRGGKERGYYDPKTGDVWLNIDADANAQSYMVFTLSHELVHKAKDLSAAKFKKFADTLLEKYGEKGISVETLIQNKIKQYADHGITLDEHAAWEEVIADACQAMLLDTNAVETMAEFRDANPSFWQKIVDTIKEFIEKIRLALKGVEPDSDEAQYFKKLDAAAQKLLENLFVDMVMDASQKGAVIRSAYGNEALSSVIKANAQPISDGTILTDGAVVTDGDGLKYSIKSMKHDIAEGKMFDDLMTYCNWTQEQVDSLRNDLNDLVEYMTPFRNILDMNETYGREGRRFSPYKPNSDPLYKISMDFSTLCSKRLLTQYVIENLQLREQRPMSAEEQMAIRDMLNEYRKVEKGLQVACAMCYVEAARLKSPQQISKWLDDPATQLRNYFADKNPEFKAYIEGKQADFKESRGYARNATKKMMKPADVTALNKIRPSLRSQYQPSAEELEIIERAKGLPRSTYLSAGNLASLSETDPVIYSAYTAFVRTSTRSKSLETDEPYYYGDSTRDNGNGIIVSDSFIESVNRENGMRFSSWSDWRIHHLLDYITAVIDNSVRGAAMHGYTKFGEEVRVLGKTGMMFNMSGVPGTQTGLNEDGSLSFSSTESIDVDEAIQLREEFPEHAGLQCIGVSDAHIKALLRSDIIDYVIPYHVSGLNKGLRQMVKIEGWADYTGTQHAAIDKSIEFDDAVDQEHWHEEPVFSEFFVGYDTGMTGIEAMRASAERYVQMCRDRGLKPKFEQFLGEDNYWKLLIDRKMINQKTGNLIRQKAVTPTFDFNTIKGVVDRYVQNYDSGLEARALNHIVDNWDSIPARIRELKKKPGKKSKASTALDTLANETLAAQPHSVPEGAKRSMPKVDSEGKRLSEDQQEYFEDSKARDENGNLYVLFHGSRSPLFTEFDMYEGVWLTPDQRYAEVYAETWHSWRGNGERLTGLEKSVYADPDYRVYRMYANITNPLDLGEINDDFDRKQLIRLAKLLGVPSSKIKGLAYDDDGYETIAFVYQLTKQKEFIDIAREKGYDGFIATEKGRKTFCAFNSPNQVKLTTNEVPSSFYDVRYSLPKVNPVQPTTTKWSRTHDTDEVKARFPELWDVAADSSEVRNPTQISGTVKSYRKIYEYLKAEGFSGTILDASSGLGYGTRAGIEEYGFNVEDIEPYPDKSYSPKYTDYSTLHKKYDVIISNAVLNVLPQDQRDALVVKMASMLNTGGRIFINVRGRDVESASSKVAIDSGLMEYYISNTGSYQKGFTKQELVAYLDDALGHGYRVNPTSMFGAVSAVVTKVGSKNGIDNSNLIDENGSIPNSTRGGKGDNRRVRKGTAETARSSEVDGRANSERTEDAQEVQSWGDITPADQKRIVGIVDSYIGNSSNYDDLFYILCSYVHRTEDDITARMLKKAVTMFSEQLFDDAMKMNPSEFELRWSIIGNGVTGLFRDLRSAAGVKFKAPNSRGLSTRELLADAFEEMVQTPQERQMIDEYRANISKVEDVQDRLKKVRAKIHELTVSKGDKVKIAELTKTAADLADLIDKYDRKLLEMEASKPLRDVLARAKQAAYREAKQRGEERMAEYRQKVSERFDRGVESRKKTAMRQKIRKVIRDLDKILNRGDKKRNVKEGMKGFVEEALASAEILFIDNYGNEDMIRNGVEVEMTPEEEKYMTEARAILAELYNLPSGSYEAWAERQGVEESLKSKLAYRMGKLKDVFYRERLRLNKTKVADVLSKLADAYAKLETSEYAYVNGAYNEAVHQYLKTLQDEVGGATIRDMSLSQLELMHTAYKMVLHSVRKANEMFTEGWTKRRDELANGIMFEVRNAGGVHGRWSPLEIKQNQASWNNTKPIYAAERIGSETFKQLWAGLFKGQYNWALDMEEAKLFRQKVAEKYGAKQWDMEKMYTFTSASGLEFQLNLNQIMSIYAYSKREQAHDHLTKGGFVFGRDTEVIVNEHGIKKTYFDRSASAYKVSDELIEEIVGVLDKVSGAKKFVDEMQDYLSTTMGEKGNEVSMKLYGVKLFNEAFYFPLRSAGQYMERAKEADLKKQQGQVSIANSSFTHATKPKANNPVVLEGFMDVWASHVNEMSLYHSMVLPMEDFRRVYNYSSPNMEGQDSVSVNGVIENAYGPEATGYIDQLYKELNGGAVTDPRETAFKERIGKFKKAAVMLSSSVVVQQFSSVGRAYALIDPKYFIGAKVDKKRHKLLWEELKQYAPVAIIKEMGGFDTGMGGSAKDFLLAEEYGKGERIKGFVKDEQYRSEIMGFAPAKADELTWCAIWEAVKRETKANNPNMDVTSEEFLKKAGERFSEVIEKTQVYDSVLARSANMRSKNGLMQMATAFLAEPTTTVNMIEDAIRKKDKKYIARTFGAVFTSIVINNALASIVYAMRDDDDDETFLEKYTQAFTSGMLDDINPLTYYPFLKDVWSLLQGYDVERSDMSVVSDVVDAVKKVTMTFAKRDDDMSEEELAEYRKEIGSGLLGLLNAGLNALGIPFKNVHREISAIANTFKTFSKTFGSTTWNSFVDALGSSVLDSTPIVGIFAGESRTDKIYDAIISGDSTYLKRLKAGYKSEDAYNTAVRKALRENDPRIHQAALAGFNGDPSERVRIARLIIADGFSQDNVVAAINAEINKMEPDKEKSAPKAKGFYTAEDFAREIANGDQASANAVKVDIIQTAQKNGKSAEDAKKSFVSSAKTELKDLFLSGKISEQKAINALTTYCDIEESDAIADVQYWAFKQEFPEVFADDQWFDTYYEKVADSGIEIDVYMEYRNAVAGITGENKKAGRMSVINSLPITSAQKDALYLAEGWAASKLYEAPWH